MERAKERLEKKDSDTNLKRAQLSLKEQLIEFMYMASNPRHFFY